MQNTIVIPEDKGQLYDTAEITFSQIQEYFLDINYDKKTLLIRNLVFLIVFLITVFKIANAHLKESSKGWSYNSFVNIVKPILPFYIVVYASGYILDFVQLILAYIFDFSDIDSIFSIDIDDFKLMFKDKMEKTAEDMANGGFWDSVSGYFSMIGHMSEAYFLDILGFFTRYMFAFPVALYFLWLLVLNIFAPIGVVGFIKGLEDLKPFSLSWIKNYISCQIFLVACITAELVSLGIYNLYRLHGDYNIIVHLFFLIILRAFLYKQALSVSKSII